jgi:hypothetical protein
MLAVLRGFAIANLLRIQGLNGNVWMQLQVPCQNRTLAAPRANGESETRHKERVLARNASSEPE